MNRIKLTLLAGLMVAMLTTTTSAQDSRNGDKSDTRKATEEPYRQQGLKKIASGSGTRDYDIDINTHHLEATIGEAVEQAMRTVESVLENLEIHIPDIDVHLGAMNINLDALESDLDNIDIEVPEIDIEIPNIDIDIPEIDIDIPEIDPDIDTDYGRDTWKSNWNNDRGDSNDRSVDEQDKAGKKSEKNKADKDRPAKADKSKGLKKIN